MHWPLNLLVYIDVDTVFACFIHFNFYLGAFILKRKKENNFCVLEPDKWEKRELERDRTEHAELLSRIDCWIWLRLITCTEVFIGQREKVTNNRRDSGDQVSWGKVDISCIADALN